jgi:hypothetical protein
MARRLRIANISACGFPTSRTGSVLLLVLVVIAMLALGANTYLDLMQTEHRAVRRHGRSFQTLRLSESGVEYLKAFLSQPATEIQNKGGLTNNVTALKAMLADDQPASVDRGRFTFISPAQTNGLYNGFYYGVENESAKLNLNVLLAEGAEDRARDRLLVLPSMTPEIADAILDWLDSDSMPREYGAEAEYYGNLDPAYAMRNGPISNLDELLLLRGVTPELLYGFDRNRNFAVDADEQQPRGALVEVDNSEGLMNRGWSAYLTTSSVERMGGSPTAPLVDLNGGSMQTLYDGLKTKLTDEQAKFIVLYRQFGSSGGGNDRDNPGRSGDNPGSGGQPSSNGGPSGGGGAVGGGTGGQDGREANGQQNTESVPATSITINFQQPGVTQIASMLDLVGARVEVPTTPLGGESGQGAGGSSGGSGGGQGGGNGGNNNGDANNGASGGPGGPGGPGQTGGGGEQQPPPKIVMSPWEDSPDGYRELLALCDLATIVNGAVAGRVNINTASRPVLMSVPNLPLAAVEQILARREAEPNPTLSDQRHALWLVLEGIVTTDVYRQIERFITTGGDVFSGQSVGFFDADALPHRAEFVIDRAVSPPRLRHWRDLSAWGPGYSGELLGTPAP